MLTLKVGDSRPFSILAVRGDGYERLPNGASVSVKSTDPNVVSVTASPAILTAVGKGEAIVSVIWEEWSDEIAVRVETPSEVSGVKLLV